MQQARRSGQVSRSGAGANEPRPVNRIVFRALAMVALWSGTGCDQPFAAVVTDTEGHKYRTVCGEGEPCTVEQMPGPGRAGRLVVHSPGRIVGVCTSVAGTVALASCRALVCRTEKDCPASHGVEHGPCIGSLCVDPSQGLVKDDAVMLCLAGTGSAAGKPLQVERYAMALNCGSPCKIPAPCRQP